MIDLDRGDELPRADEYLNRVVGYRGGIPQYGAMPDDEEQQKRLTVGQRIGGAVPDVTPPPTEQPPQVRPPFDPNLVPESIRPRTMPAPDQIARPPVGVNSQRRLDLMAEESKLNKPTDPGAIDPNTGKPKYRMGWGQRVLGTLAAAGQGFAGRPYTGPYLGPGATNWKFDREENLRRERLAGVQSDLSEQEKLESSQERAYADAQKAAYESQLGEARLGTSRAQQETADTKKALETTQADLNRARTNRLDVSPSDQRAADADKYGLTGEARTDYVLTGRLPKEMMGAGRQPTELETWITAFRRDNGRDPTADEIATRRSNRASLSDKIERDKDTALQRAEAKATKRLKDLSDPKNAYDPTDPRPIQVRKQGIYDDLEKEKQQIQKDYETRAAANAGGGRSAPGSVSAPQRITAPQKPTQPAPAGRVWVYDKKTGARGTIPASQLRSATSGTNAQYGTW